MWVVHSAQQFYVGIKPQPTTTEHIKIMSISWIYNNVITLFKQNLNFIIYTKNFRPCKIKIMY